MSKRSRSSVPPAAHRPGPASEFQPDYTHIRTDLRRIGLLAGTFVVVLLVASFFVR